MHFRHRLQYGVYAAIKGLLLGLPHRSTPAFGRGLGEVVFRLDRRDRRITLDNLTRAFPERPPQEHRRLARACFREVGADLCETLSAARFTPEELRQHLIIEGWEHLERAREGGRGALLLGAHLGCFELTAYAVALKAGTVHLVSSVLSNPLFDRELRRLRQPFGIQIIERKGAARRMYKVLRQGGLIGVALDQRPKPHDAIDVQFFGRRSLSSPLPAYLSLWTGAPVVPVFTLPAADRYRMVVRPPIEPAGEGKEAIARLTQRYTDVIEEEIRRQPARWLWMYRRWRERDADPIRSSLALGPPPIRQPEVRRPGGARPAGAGLVE